MELKDLLPEGVFATTGKVFRLVQVAEEEIEDATKRYPWKAREFQDAFQHHLFPGELVRFSPEVYRAHARELLQRVANGEDLDQTPGTDAECLVALSLASLKAPLASGHLAAMERVFSKVYPERKGENVGREAWPGETEEILSELRRRIGRRRKS